MSELEFVCRAVLDDAKCKCRRRASCVGCNKNLASLRGILAKREEIRKFLPDVILLSGREIQVVKYLGAGIYPKAIASILGISRSTVEAHRTRAMKKLDIYSVVDLVLWSIRIGLVNPYTN